MAWKFWMGILVFRERTCEEAADALLEFANDRIPPIGNGVDTEVPPRDQWLTVFDVNNLSFCV